MTIDGAIKHCEEVAAEKEDNARWKLTPTWQDECKQCAADHRQLAEWLKELKETRRLLKLAVEDLNHIGSCKTCVKSEDVCRGCRTDYKWVHADEAAKLLKEG